MRRCRLGCLVWLGVFGVIHQVHELGTGHLAQGGQWQRIRLAVIVNIDVQAIHHIEMRVGKEFFHGRVFHIGGDLVPNKGTVIGRGGQLPHVIECGGRKLRRSRSNTVGPVGSGTRLLGRQCFARRFGRRGFALPHLGFPTGPSTQEALRPGVTHPLSLPVL